MDNGFEALKDNQGIYEDCKLAEKMISGTTRVEILTALRSYGTAFEKMVNALILKAGITSEQVLRIKRQNGKDGIVDLYGKIMALKVTGFISAESGINYESLRKYRNSAIHEAENAGGKCYQTMGIGALRREAMNMRSVMLVEANRFEKIYMQKNVMTVRKTATKNNRIALSILAVAAMALIIGICLYLIGMMAEEIRLTDQADISYSQVPVAEMVSSVETKPAISHKSDKAKKTSKAKKATKTTKKRAKQADPDSNSAEQTVQSDSANQEQPDQIQAQINDVEAKLAQDRTDFMNSTPGSQEANDLFNEIGKLGQKRVDLYGQLYQAQFNMN